MKNLTSNTDRPINRLGVDRTHETIKSHAITNKIIDMLSVENVRLRSVFKKR